MAIYYFTADSVYNDVLTGTVGGTDVSYNVFTAAGAYVGIKTGDQLKYQSGAATSPFDLYTKIGQCYDSDKYYVVAYAYAYTGSTNHSFLLSENIMLINQYSREYACGVRYGTSGSSPYRLAGFARGGIDSSATGYYDIAPMVTIVDSTTSTRLYFNDSLISCRIRVPASDLMLDSNGVLLARLGSGIHVNLSTSDYTQTVNKIEEYTPPVPDPTDPYTPGGDTGDDETEGTGGDGTYDDTTEDVEVPDLPTLSATDSGFLSLYNPTLAQLQALGAYMWSPLFDLDTFKKLFSDPMGAILGLAIVPVAPPVSGTVSVVLGNVDSGIVMPLVSTQYVTADMGSITIDPYWGAYLDYSPYTTVELYLPFIGSKRLDADDVMGKTVGVVYKIDLLSGACVALVTVDGSVMYQYIGQCSSSVPITGNDLTNVINGALSIAGAVGGAATIIGSGGAASPAVFGAISVSAHSVMSSKPRVEKSGATSGMGGMLAVGKPFVTITRPRQALPSRQNEYTGYPSWITRTLGTISGYTEVMTAHLEGMTCTDAEKQEIMQLLRQGVFF